MNFGLKLFINTDFRFENTDLGDFEIKVGYNKIRVG